MTRPSYVPADYKRIKVVSSLSELFNTSFGGPDGVNCILFPRKLTGNFNALVNHLNEVVSIEDQMECGSKLLEGLKIIAATGNEDSVAAQNILNDIRVVGGMGAVPYFRMIRPEDKNYDGQRFFHEDRIGTEKDIVARGLILSCYTMPVTEYLRDGDSHRINEIFHHAWDAAKILRFVPGDMWRHAGSYEEGISVVPPFIHRAPHQHNDKMPRLLLVGI